MRRDRIPQYTAEAKTIARLEQLERYGDRDDIETPMLDTLRSEAIDRLRRGRACLCCDGTNDSGAFCVDCSAWIGEMRGTVARRGLDSRVLDFRVRTDDAIQDQRRLVWDVIDNADSRNAAE